MFCETREENLFTIYRGKPVGTWFVQKVGKTSRMGNSFREKHIPFVKFTLTYKEFGTSLTIDTELELVEKSKWNTIFRLDIPFGNFGKTLKTLRSFWEFTHRAECLLFLGHLLTVEL